MKTLSVRDLEDRLLMLGENFAHDTKISIADSKHGLMQLIMEDDMIDADEIDNLDTQPMSIKFRIVKKGGRVNRDTGSRTGAIKHAITVKFTFRKFTDGGYHTKVELGF